MRVLSVERQNEIIYKDIPIPKLKADEILCKVAYTGICGTDLVIYSGETNFVKDGLIKYPVRIGHEWSGYVESVGADVTKFKKGDRVVSDNFVGCRQCQFCRKGEYNKCSNLKSLGTINCWDGSYAEYIVMPECHLFHLPDEIDMKSAVLIEPLTVSYSGMINYNINKNSNVAIIGTGPIGLCAAAIAKQMGAGKIIVIGRTNKKLELAKKLGATHIININEADAETEVHKITNGAGADLVVETSGAASTVQQALDVAATRANICLLGFFEEKTNNLMFNRAVSKELTIKGVLGGGNVQKIIDFMLHTKLKIDSIITNIINFDETKNYFENCEKLKKDNIKVLVKIWGEIK